MPIEYRFIASEAFFVEAFERHRSQVPWLGWLRTLRYILAIPLILLCLFMSYVGAISAAIILAVFVALLLQGSRLDNWMLKRNLRKSPYNNDTIVTCLSDTGMEANGKLDSARINWATFTKATRFADGWLLHRGPHLFNWLPDNALHAGAELTEASALIRAHVGHCVAA